MSQGFFDGAMPRKVLEYYLSHAASAQWISMSDTLDDDIRVILKTSLKFLGRAAGEDRENTLTKGSFYLTDEEERQLRLEDFDDADAREEAAEQQRLFGWSRCRYRHGCLKRSICRWKTAISTTTPACFRRMPARGT